MLRILSLIIVILLPFSCFAQDKDWAQELAEDMIEIVDGTMLFDEVGICKMAFEGYQPASVQVKIHSEAPAEAGISRDNFVAYTSTMTWVLLTSSFAELYKITASVFLQGFKYEELDSLIGKADLEFNIYMTGQGMQIEIVNTSTGQKNRITQLWSDLNS